VSELDVADVERTVVRLPYRDRIREHMDRWLPHWRYAEVAEVTLESGVTGVGETMVYYTWGAPDEEDVERVRGQNAVEFLWDDSLGAGLQMALFDAVGRALDVPAHELVGERTRETVPLSWWAMDMPGEDWLAECETAIERGYTDIKVKGRPWFDVRAIVAELAGELPDSFGIDVDFNETLLDAGRARPVLEELEALPQIETFESPIPQEDVEGGRALVAGLDANVAIHYGRPQPETALTEPICDGFVLNEGASATVRQGATVDAVGRQLWLQLVGSGITTAFALQLGCVLEAAEWPAITCHELYDETLVEGAFDVDGGRVAVPEGPGLGVDLDRSAVDRLAVDRPAEQPEPDCLVRTTLADGTDLYFTDGYQMQRVAERGDFPFYERGVETEVLSLDTPERRDLHERARGEHVRVEPSE